MRFISNFNDCVKIQTERTAELMQWQSKTLKDFVLIDPEVDDMLQSTEDTYFVRCHPKK